MAAWFILSNDANHASLFAVILEKFLVNAAIKVLRQSSMSSKHYIHINNKNYIKRLKQQTKLS